MIKTKNYLKDYVGQSHIVGYANLVLDAVASGRNYPFQPWELRGMAGLGKNHLADTVGRAITKLNNEFEYIEMSSAITLPAFFKFYNDHIEGKRVIVFVDEAHYIKNGKVLNILKRLLETEKQPKQITHEEHTLEANPFNHLWLFATNEFAKDTALFGPTSRTKELQFEPFTPSEAFEVIMLKAEKWKISITESAAEFLVYRVLPNGRAISELIEDEVFLLSKGKTFTIEMAKELVRHFGRFEKGLMRSDIQTLKFIGTDERGKQVQEIAAANAGEDPRHARYRLQCLAGLGLMRTGGNGRKVLTDDGRGYLEKLEQQIKGMQARKVAAMKKAKAVVIK